MGPDFPHRIFDILSCTGAQWIVDKVMIEHPLHSVLICDIHTARFLLDCSPAAVCPCMLFRVRCRPHSEGCDGTSIVLVLVKIFTELSPRQIQSISCNICLGVCLLLSPWCNFFGERLRLLIKEVLP